MGLGKTIWANPADFLRKSAAETSVLFFAPTVLQATARRFRNGFPGLVTYAVKSNPSEQVLLNLATAGVTGFDVASLEEIGLVQRVVPGATLHFNNPVRTAAEIEAALHLGVRSFSVDSRSELEKLIAAGAAAGTEVSIRFKQPVAGAAYDFGAKFGATEELAADLMRRADAAGLTVSLTFHPGTQCTDAGAWGSYIQAAARIARNAGVAPARLNVGGGFPSHRAAGDAPSLEAIFAVILGEARAAFGRNLPALLCEPGRGLVGDAFALAAQVRAVRDDGDVFLNDGIYGGLAETALLGVPERIELRAPDGSPRRGALRPRIVFGPTCDSVDRLPGMLHLPEDIAEGDWLIFHSMGAYCAATSTRFNGFGALSEATVLSLGAD